MRRMTKHESFSRFFKPLDNKDECWPWLGGFTKGGYGVFCAEGRSFRAHRYAYTITYLGGREPPEELVVMHKCDNPICCNPHHLLLGTHLDNIADRTAKRRTVGQMKPGADHPNSKLTDDDVMTIRASIEPWKILMARYSISKSLIALIKNGAIWKHLPTESAHKYARRKNGDSSR